MVDHVLQCVDRLVRCVRRHEGACDGQRLLGIVELCVNSYGNGGTVGSCSACGTSPDVNSKLLCDAAPVVCCNAPLDGVARETSRIVCLYSGLQGGVTEPGDVKHDSRGGECSNAGLVNGAVDDFPVKVNGKEESWLGASVDCDFKESVSWCESKTERNRRWRKEKKTKKKNRQFLNKDWRDRSSSVEGSRVSCGWRKGTSTVSSLVGLSDLRKSLEDKWKFQNELAAEKARRELEVLKASDIDQEKKRYRTKVSAATERNMVSIEKTHAKLRQTGNLPNEQGGGFAETIVSGVPGLDASGGTISPDSSASMAEFRACQKALLDAEKALLEERNKLQIVKDRFGIPVDFLDTIDKETWTIGDHNEAALDAWYPNGYGINTMCSPEGKFHAIKV